MKALGQGAASARGGTVVPFPARGSARDRLTESDLDDLFARWLKGDVLDVETAEGGDFNCFLEASLLAIDQGNRVVFDIMFGKPGLAQLACVGYFADGFSVGIYRDFDIIARAAAK